MVSASAPPAAAASYVLQGTRGDDIATRVNIFEDIYLVFLVLGTLVGVIVVSYMLHKAYKYRAGAGHEYDVDRPQLGELPTGADKGGRKLFVSFFLSAIVVVSLIAWTYSWLLVVETGTAQVEDEDIEAGVVGNEFSWTFEYWDDERLAEDELEEAAEDLGEASVAAAIQEAEGDPDQDLDAVLAEQYAAEFDDEGDVRTAQDIEANNLTVPTTFRVPIDHTIHLRVTAQDVWHAFGVSEFRVKADAIPGETTRTWFVPDREGEFQAECFELCGSQHTAMLANVEVLPEDEYESWYAEQTIATDEALAQLEAGEYLDEEDDADENGEAEDGVNENDEAENGADDADGDENETDGEPDADETAAPTAGGIA